MCGLTREEKQKGGKRLHMQMRPPTCWSVRMQLMGLVLCAMMPVFGILYYSSWEHQQQLAKSLQDQMLGSAIDLGDVFSSLVVDTRRLLTTLADTPEVRNQNTAACNDLFRQIISTNPQFGNLSAATPDGNVFASAIPYKGNFSKRTSFQGVLKNRDFTVSGYVIGPMSGKPVLSFGYPVKGSMGEITAILQISVVVQSFGNMINPAKVPPGSQVAISDFAGHCLYAYPEGSARIGNPDDPNLFRQMVYPAGSFEHNDRYGKSWLVSYQRLSLVENGKPQLFVRIAVPKAPLTAQTNALLYRNLELLFMAALLGVLLAWYAGGKTIVSPIASLIIAAERVRSGDLQARVDVSRMGKELRELVGVFNDMAATLKAREQDRQNAATAVRKSEERLRLFTQQLPLAVIEWNMDGRVSRWNPTAEVMLGYTAAEAVGKPVEFIVPESDKGLANLLWGDLVAQKGGEKNKCANLTKQGRIIQCEWHNTPLVTTEGKVIGVVSVGQDITQREHSAEELRESEERYRVLVQHAPEAIVVYDADDAWYIDANHNAEQLFACSQEELLRLGPEAFFAAEQPDGKSIEQSIAINRQRALAGEDVVFERAIHNAAGQDVFCEVRLVCMPYKGHKLIRSSYIDVTNRKRSEQELARRAAELVRSNAELQQFAYVASHDLQEPLRMVSSYTQLLARRYKGRLDQDADDFIGFAVDGADRMRKLIDGLLAYSRVGTRGQPFTQVNMRRVYDQAVANLEIAIAESSGQVTCSDLPVVYGDEQQLVQLFQNLIGNALKFRGQQSPIVQVSSFKQHDEWIFAIKDHGIGIDPMYFDRIFEIFQRLHAKDEYPGTGIGLAICKKVVQRHGGRIWVESQPGAGSTFYIAIPAKGDV